MSEKESSAAQQPAGRGVSRAIGIACLLVTLVLSILLLLIVWAFANAASAPRPLGYMAALVVGALTLAFARWSKRLLIGGADELLSKRTLYATGAFFLVMGVIACGYGGMHLWAGAASVGMGAGALWLGRRRGAKGKAEPAVRERQ